MSRRAVIDIGTNSVKLIVGEAADSGLSILHEAVLITRLGQGLHLEGRLSAVAIARTLDAVLLFVRKARALGADPVLPVGTMALRRASNADEFAAGLLARGGPVLRILSGEEEASLSHAAAIASLPIAQGRLCVFDVGGGSTEFSVGTGAECEKRLSIDLGCRRPSEQYLTGDPPGAAQLAALRAHVAETLADAFPNPGALAMLVGVGGTLTSISSVARGADRFDPLREHGAVLTLAAVELQLLRYASLSLAERRAIPGLTPDRADVILAGAAIVAAAMALFSAAELTVSHRGLRHALLSELCAAGN